MEIILQKQLLEKGEELHRSRQELRDLAQEAMQSDDIRLTAALQQAQSLEAQLKAARDEAEKANLALLERGRNEVEQDTTTAAPEPQVTPTLDAAAEHLLDLRLGSDVQQRRHLQRAGHGRRLGNGRGGHVRRGGLQGRIRFQRTRFRVCFGCLSAFAALLSSHRLFGRFQMHIPFIEGFNSIDIGL